MRETYAERTRVSNSDERYSPWFGYLSTIPYVPVLRTLLASSDSISSKTIGRYFKITIFLLERIYLGKLNFTQLVRLRCAFTSKETFSNERVERKKKACASYYTYASSNKQGTLSVPHLSLATSLLLSVYLIGDCKDRS